MANINVTLEDDVDITVKEFYEEMDDSEKKEMLDLLRGEKRFRSGGCDEDFDQEVSKLIGNRWRLSLEDEETIMRIANKVVA